MNHKRKSKGYGVVMIGLILLWGCGGGGVGMSLNGEEMGDFRDRTLEELNKLRTDPLGYLVMRKIDEKKDCRDGKGEESRVKLSRGGEFSKAVGKLELDDRLNRVAQEYSEFLALENVFGHRLYGDPRDRCKWGGYLEACGENLAANTADSQNGFINAGEAAAWFVEQLVIDCQVQDRGHLKNMMDKDWKSVGIGYYRYLDSKYKNYVVHNFGPE